MILTLRTDKPDAEIALYTSGTQLCFDTWVAHRQLAETLHTHIKALLDAQDSAWSDITAIVCYKGPGSFTGLRIGLSMANALARSLNIPIVGTTGDDWVQEGLHKLANNNNEQLVAPDYGAPVHITQQKK